MPCRASDVIPRVCLAHCFFLLFFLAAFVVWVDLERCTVETLSHESTHAFDTTTPPAAIRDKPQTVGRVNKVAGKRAGWGALGIISPSLFCVGVWRGEGGERKQGKRVSARHAISEAPPPLQRLVSRRFHLCVPSSWFFFLFRCCASAFQTLLLLFFLPPSSLAWL